MNTVTERVERGAALLDEKIPGWWRQIDLGRLDISSGCNCVIGQLYSDAAEDGYPAVPYEYGLNDLEIDDEAVSACGFDKDDNWPLDASVAEVETLRKAQYGALTAAWRDLITGRREHAGVPA